MKIADELKAIPESTPEAPKSLLDRIISLTPVVMTVVATILAGLSSSEMSAAQYHRSMAAQYQSKAGDQWGFYQAKKMREGSNENTVELLDGLVGPRKFNASAVPTIVEEAHHRLALLIQSMVAATAPVRTDTAQINDLVAQADKHIQLLDKSWNTALSDSSMSAAIRYLDGDDLPAASKTLVPSAAITSVLNAIDAGKSERETVPLVLAVKRDDLDQAEAEASADADAFDAATKPIIASVDKLGSLLAAEVALLRDFQRQFALDVPVDMQGNASLLRDAAFVRQPADDLMGSFSAARLRLDARRYQQESAYNIAIARLYEVEVRLASGQSDRNQLRSKDFFYGMLVAQAAVTIATFSLAVRQRSFLWGLASSAGLIAVSLGVYVYLFT